MPFGSAILEDGRVSFSLWAPKAQSVELCLYEDKTVQYLDLSPQSHGWYSLITDRAQVGTLYNYRINRNLIVPDPASRSNPQDIYGPSEVIDPQAYDWQDHAWQGRPWETAVIYEIHTGTFTQSGTFRGIIEKLDYLVSLGVTAIELMPIADFPGSRNWGYDGVLLFAPDSSYGKPDDLKLLIDQCHTRGLMVFLDVVYNHFGPEGNYLGSYAPQFFSKVDHTPWGSAINYSGKDSRVVRDFFIHNALFWFEEYHIDGLRLDAVQSIIDKSSKHILTEIAENVRMISGSRYRHLVLENEDNAAHYLGYQDGADATVVNAKPVDVATIDTQLYNAQWNDDIHNAIHVLSTGEREGYYADFGTQPLCLLGRCLTEGFGYQGELSLFRKRKRGERSSHLSPTCFVNFSQNHDRVGNLPFGDRMHRYAWEGSFRAFSEILMLAPGIPLIFMGQEFLADSPFLFFCDFKGDLAQAVREGRERDYRRRGFLRKQTYKLIDPNSPEAFSRSKMSWGNLEQIAHSDFLQLMTKLLSSRNTQSIPQLSLITKGRSSFVCAREALLAARWEFPSGTTLLLHANLSSEHLSWPDEGDALSGLKAGGLLSGNALIYSTTGDMLDVRAAFPPWFVQWSWHRAAMG